LALLCMAGAMCASKVADIFNAWHRWVEKFQKQKRLSLRQPNLWNRANRKDKKKYLRQQIDQSHNKWRGRV
jgi:hypothetical protein